jgi:hypothetical protein
VTRGAVRWSGRIDVDHFLRQVVSIADAVPDECGGPKTYEHLRRESHSPEPVESPTSDDLVGSCA